MPTQRPDEPIIQVTGSQAPNVTVYIPIHLPQSGPMFFYYTFKYLSPQAAGPPPFSLVTERNQEFMVSESGTITADGYRVPLARRRSPPVLAAPPPNSGLDLHIPCTYGVKHELGRQFSAGPLEELQHRHSIE